MKEFNCNIIQKELMSWVMASTTDIVVPNYFLGRWECDVMKVSKAGQIYEYEIKVSKADFKNDAKKSKDVYTGNNESVILDSGRLYSKRVYDKKSKHSEILEGRRCSRFYFVVPENLIQPNEVPDGLGLIYASPSFKEGNLKFRIVKVSRHFKKDPVKIEFYRHISQNLTLKLIAAKRRLITKKKNA